MSMRNAMQDGVMKRKRIMHHKSRNGCLECKRRRVKCDETKPSCLRCALSFDKCSYATPPQPILQEPVQVPISSLDTYSPSPSLTSPLPFPPSSPPSLYQHYLQHTNRTLSLSRSTTTIPISIPFLAYTSRTIFHALLAVSATSLAWTMISASPHADIATVQSTMLTGYAHYNLASQAMRNALADQAQEALVASVILVPFAAGSQQIRGWLSRRNGRATEVMASMPRDVIVLVRGVRTILRELGYVDLHTGPTWTAEIGFGLAEKRTRVISGVIASTSKVAFEMLKERLETLDDQALETTFGILEMIRTSALSAAERELRDPALDTKLRPMRPATRNFLTFLSQVPQEYLDIVLPLLDQRLDSPVCSSKSILSPIQALALDIYAHWSVLMFLVRDKWFIGDLPVVTLKGMVNRYGEGFAGTLYCEDATEKRWWPGSMLRIWLDVESYW